MAKRSGHTRAARRGPKNNLWTVVVQDEISIGAGGALRSNIVVAADWERSTGGNERATLLTIRGWFAITSKPNAGVAASGGSIHAYIGIFDEDETPPLGDLASTYSQEDVIWTDGWTFPGAADVSDPMQTYKAHVHVKAMRKIRSGQKVSLVIDSGLTTAVQTNGVLRALLRLGGN